MFDRERPARVQRTIWVAAYNTEALACARCTEQVFPRDVAFYTRTAPGDPFDPWCKLCAGQFSRWALRGLDASPEEDVVVVGVVFGEAPVDGRE